MRSSEDIHGELRAQVRLGRSATLRARRFCSAILKSWRRRPVQFIGAMALLLGLNRFLALTQSTPAAQIALRWSGLLLVVAFVGMALRCCLRRIGPKRTETLFLPAPEVGEPECGGGLQGGSWTRNRYGGGQGRLFVRWNGQRWRSRCADGHRRRRTGSEPLRICPVSSRAVGGTHSARGRGCLLAGRAREPFPRTGGVRVILVIRRRFPFLPRPPRPPGQA
jgi:hypothetical protein